MIRPWAGSLVGALGVLISSCATTPVRPTPKPAVRVIAGYPLKFNTPASAEAKQAREHALSLRSPGWTFNLDEHTWLLGRATRLGGTSAPLLEEDLPELRRFLETNRDVLGLGEAEIPMPGPIVGGDRIQLVQPDGRPGILIARNGVERGALPDFRNLPEPLSDDVLLAPFVGWMAGVRVRSCPWGSGVGRPCDAAGPNECQPAPVVEQPPRPLTRADLWLSQRYWQFFRVSPATVEYRYVGELRATGRQCGSGAWDLEELLSVPALPPYVDLLTGAEVSSAGP